jgi:hypothetical protein
MNGTHGPAAPVLDDADVSPARLWFALAAAPVAWIAEGLFGWFFGARICTAFSIPTVRLLIGGFSLVMLGTAVSGLVIGVRSWRAAREVPRPPADRVEFMAIGGVLVSAAFVVGIFWSGITAAVLDVCGWMR